MKEKTTHTKRNNLAAYRNAPLFHKFDIVLAIILIVIIALSIVLIVKKDVGKNVEIYYKGDLIGTYPLDVDRNVIIEKVGKNTICIDGLSVYMLHSDCDNQLCVQTKKISKSGERIVCAPNGIVVLISGEGEVDGVTGGAA